jgi:hypothetical protein
MKKIYIVCVLLIMAVKIQAQDIIIKTDKVELKAKVLEIGDEAIKYKKFEFLDGPTYSIRKADVFMIIYQNGKKEYMEGTIAAPKPVAATVVPVPRPAASVTPMVTTPVTTESAEDVEKEDNWINSMAVDDAFTSLDFEFNKKLAPNIYLGLSGYSSFSSTPSSGGIFPFLAYKLPLDKTKSFYLWGNAGYNFSFTGSSSYGRVYVPATSSSDFLWEIGADYYFNKSFGITVYSPQASNIWFGVVFKSKGIF